MSKAAETATKKAIQSRVKPTESFTKQNRDRLTKSEAKTVRKAKRRNVKSAAEFGAKAAVKNIYESTPIRNRCH